MRTFVVIVLIFASGCSNHPLVGDVTGYTTYDVVHKVRCEAKGALEAYRDEKGFGPKGAELKSVQKEIETALKEIKGDDARATLVADRDILNADIDANRRRLAFITVQLSALRNRLIKLPEEKAKLRTDLLAEVAAIEAEISAARSKQAADSLAEKTALLQARLAELPAREASLDQEQEQIRKTVAKLEADVKTRNSVSGVLTAAKKGLEDQYKPFKDQDTALKALEGRIASEKDLGATFKFMNSSIAMQFRFDITEANTATVGGAYKMPAYNVGSLTIGYAAGTSNKRRGERAVGVATSFVDLLEVKCGDARMSDRKRAHFYPITGNIGIKELVAQYLKLTETAVLAQSAATAGATKQFIDRLVFTTKVNAGVSPKLELNPTPQHKLTLNGDLAADREDIHEVIVDIAPPAKASPAQGPTKVTIEKDVGIRIIQERDIGDVPD